MKRTETFQNILVMSAADGKIDSSEKDFIDGISYQLGITDEEYAFYMKQIGELDFIIPRTKEEAYNELHKMTLISITDGEFSEEEEEALFKFASAAGLTEAEYANYVESVCKDFDAAAKVCIENNKSMYDEVLRRLRNSGKSDMEIGAVFKEVTKTHNLDFQFSSDPTVNHAFYCFLWLLYCRHVKIVSGGLVTAMMALEFVITGEYVLEDLFYDLKLTEDLAKVITKLHIVGTDLDVIKTELSQTFPFFVK